MSPSRGIEQAIGRCHRLLQRRMRSTEEVRRYLLAAGFPTDIVDSALTALTRQGLLDDEAFAKAWTESRREHRPRSSLLIQKELREKGIAADLASRATSDMDDEAVASRLAQRRAAQMSGLDRTTFLRRLARYLYSRGFSHATVARALAHIGTPDNVS